MQPTSPHPHRDAASGPLPPRPPRLLVVGSGLEGILRQPNGPTELAADQLAHALDLPRRRINDPDDPHGELRQLDQTSGGWLANLPLDPGQSLRDGGTWAEALGAWRQPTLLIISWQQLASGAAAATTALMRQWGVPILGLVQWGGTWEAEGRRRDGLPWIGQLAETPATSGDGSADPVAELLLRRWLLLDASEPAGAGS